jgi:FixJ family two-component response regulator
VSTRPLHILLASSEPRLAESLTEILQDRGHRVVHVPDAETAITVPEPEVFLLDVGLDSIRGLDALERFRRNGSSSRCVVLSAVPSLDACRRAMRLGAEDFLTTPLDVRQLVSAVEGDPAHTTSRARRKAHAMTYDADPASVERGTRNLAAYALQLGITPACRARIASCCAEILDNAQRHAYPLETGLVHVNCEVVERELVVTIRDQGVGFDAVTAGLERMRRSLDGGLARVSALSEHVLVESEPGRGTSVRARFALYRSALESDGELDLSELDWFEPSTSRMVLESLADAERSESFQLSPALAVTLGRLLAGPDSRRVLQTALWS